MELWKPMKYALYAAVLLLSVQTVQLRAPGPSLEAALHQLFPPAPTSKGSGPSVNIGCVILHCTPQSFGCVTNEVCRSAIECSQKCLNAWGNDTTKEKFHVQNCTNKCAFSYNDEAYDNFMACMSDNKCISFPPIPDTCRRETVRPLKTLGLKDLEGAWWVVRGFHPVYDCYPCQHLFFKAMNTSTWDYAPEYQVYLVNGSLSLVSQHMVIPYVQPGKNISFVYHDEGLEHFETWWLIDEADDGSYILLYYCGNTLQWYYEGALVFARDRTLPEVAYKSISESYQMAVGLDSTDFCRTSTSSSCPD